MRGPCGKERLRMHVKASKAMVMGLLGIGALVAFGALVGSARANEDAWLGVVLQPLTESLRQAMDIGPDVQGVLVGDIIDGSPADESGIEEGDVITSIDGKAMSSVGQIVEAVSSRSPGESIEVGLVRNGHEQTVRARLAEREKGLEVSRGVLPQLEKALKWKAEPRGYLGVEVHNLSADLAGYFDVGPGEGVLVLDVAPGSPADKAGIEAGDVIVGMGGKPVTDADELVKYITGTAPGEQVDFRIKRHRRTETVEVALGEAESPVSAFVKQLKNPGRHESFFGPWCNTAPSARDYQNLYRMRQNDVRDEIQDLRDQIKELRQELEEMRK
jgi:C-terminal processing protease CtpA/Prc